MRLDNPNSPLKLLPREGRYRKQPAYRRITPLDPLKNNTMNRKTTPILLLISILFVCLSANRSVAAVGGGYTACGLKGEYFPNAHLTAPPAFVRQDNRLSFDWGSNAPVGGSLTPAFHNFPHDNFTVRWTGKLVPRFSEPYTFTADTGQGVRVWIGKDLVIDRWSNGSAVSSKPVSLTAGTAYDIKIEYRQETGPAKMTLKWSSPSTPQEVVDPLSVRGLNVDKCVDKLFADDSKYCLGENGPIFFADAANPRDGKNLAPADLDDCGWPKTDACIRANTSFGNSAFLMQFTGKADVACQMRWYGGEGTFVVNGEEYKKTLPSGVGYDEKTNTTTALVTPPHSEGRNIQYALVFTNTQRDKNAAPNSGITNLHMMRPQSMAPGAPPCEPGTIVYPGVKAVLENYEVLRFIQAGFADERVWSDRTLPSMPNAFGSMPKSPAWASKVCWEYAIMLANELGKDLYLSIPVHTDHDYHVNLANLMKYGSDGVKPYTSYSQWPASGPAYPPLNTNLRFYIEYGNEVWNFGFPQFGWARDDSNNAAAKKTPDGLAVTYDGKGAGDISRWQAVQSVNISNAFRAVFGDAAMGDRIRVLLFDQYGMYGNRMGEFLDGYFNKTDPKSTFVGEPHPVSYYIWGGGGAIYYGSIYPAGVDRDVRLANGSFETPALADGVSQADPKGSGWTFTGNAGICRNIARRQAITGQILGEATTPAEKGWIGFKFTVGDKPVYVYDVGRMSGPEKPDYTYQARLHNIAIFKTGGAPLLANNINTEGTTPDQVAWTRVIEPGWTRNLQIPLKLEANTSYYLMSHEGADSCYPKATGTPAPGITINAAVTSPEGAFKPVESGTEGVGAVNFTYATEPEGDLGFICDAPEGKQAAYIEGDGTMSQTVNFTKPGNYAIGFNAAIKPGAANAVDIYVDDVKCTPVGGINPPNKVADGPWSPGGFERRADDLAIGWGSAVVPITKPGAHTIQIKGAGGPGKFLFFDDMKILNVESIYGPGCSYFPAMGEANGQDPRGGINAFINALHSEVNWAAAWGLKTMAYEGGWSVGGDFDQKPIHAYCKYASPLTLDADKKAIDVYTSGGGALFCYYYAQWPGDDTDNAVQYPLVKAAIRQNDQLAAEANFGALIPGTLTPATITLLSTSNADMAGSLAAQGAWASWNIIAPATQTYHLAPEILGEGIPFDLLVDDLHPVVESGGVAGDPGANVKLTKGQHTVKIRNSGTGPIAVKNIAISMPGGPEAPTLAPANFGNGSCVLAWNPVPAATGYIVYYGTVSGNYTTSVKAGNATTLTIDGLDTDAVYYFVVQASDADGLLSMSSNEQRAAHRSTEPETLVDFEDQPVNTATPDNKKPTELKLKDYLFTEKGRSVLTVQGPENHVLGVNWGRSHCIQRADLKPFDLYSLDLVWRPDGTAKSAVITGYDPSGASFRKLVNFAPSKEQFVLPVVLDWAHVAKVEIQWFEKPDGGGGNRYGYIDNLLFNKAQKR